MKNRSILAITFLLLLSSCASTHGVHLKNGDLLLVSANDAGLSKAIDAVTQTDKKTHYSHIALLEKDKKTYYVLHAGTKNGSERIPLQTFVTIEHQDNQSIAVYRLKNQYQKTIPNAIITAKTWLGKPYNYSYVLSNEKLYCSDFVQRSFAKDSIFELNPMTFKNPSTGETDPTWIEFYKKQDREVPEGQLGCNPNGLAASPKVKMIGIITK
ncbi:MAG: hypothetical protein M9916_06120 [Crocinitomicaceae bacterium]|nr:hypothetical protein [Crocinitomicaceae bacterium]